jgi:2-dehydro-3-deoxygluconokinase
MESLSKKKVVTFGEVMMRLSPPGVATFSQTQSMDITYGGGEANVSIALAYMGLQASHVTRFPDNNLGRAATQFLRHHWIDTAHVVYGDQQLGLYFLEKGAIHRSSEIVYQRAGSSFSMIQPDMIDWEKILKGTDWFHWTGITPAVSEGAAACCAQAIKTANKLGITVSGDIHSRSSLWNYGKDPREIMRSLINGTDVVIAGQYDMDKYAEGNSSEMNFKEQATQFMKEFARIKKVVDKDRTSVSGSHNKIKGKLWNGKQLFESAEYDITPIVDRVGTGDAFAAGLIYGLMHYKDEEAIQFATAACALKHSVEGDANLVSQQAVVKLMNGDNSGKIQR